MHSIKICIVILEYPSAKTFIRIISPVLLKWRQYAHRCRPVCNTYSDLIESCQQSLRLPTAKMVQRNSNGNDAHGQSQRA